VRIALRERLDRLRASATFEDPVNRLHRFLVDEVWPQVPVEMRGGLTKRERETILGYGPEGV
jgi:antitoxin VapB